MNSKLVSLLVGKPMQRLLCGAVLLLVAPLTVAESSVWEVKGGNNVLYLGGTMHLLRAEDYPLPDQYEQAYQASDELYFEANVDAMMSPEAQALFARELTYQDGRSLQTVLSEDAYQALVEYMDGAGLKLEMMQQFKPGMLVMNLQVGEFLKLGYTPMGVDAYFSTRGMGDGKSIHAFETVEEQIGFLATMGEGNESEFMLMSLEELERTGEFVGEGTAAWREGDIDALGELFLLDMQQKVPQIYDSLLRQRNLRWLPRIEQMLSDDDIEFVLVGVAHMVGEDGLVKLLQDAGYEVTQLR